MTKAQTPPVPSQPEEKDDAKSFISEGMRNDIEENGYTHDPVTGEKVTEV